MDAFKEPALLSPKIATAIPCSTDLRGLLDVDVEWVLPVRATF
jgi:hypothetical protein